MSDLANIVTREDFARELTALRNRAGMTVRKVSSATGMSVATVGDYFSGAHLPRPKSLVTVLETLGVMDAEVTQHWLHALDQVRAARVRRSAGAVDPYRGLASYQPEDAGWFFGRERLVDFLADRLGAQYAAGRRLLVLVGPSGSGKSSVLRAGLIPMLRSGAVFAFAGPPQPCPVLVFTPGEHPRQELAAQLAAHPEDATDDGTRSAAPSPPSPRLTIVVDQFEEVFTACPDEEERRAFIAALCAPADAGRPDAEPAAACDNLRPASSVIVIGLRADFYARALRYPQFACAVQDSQVVVEPMTDSDLRRAIEEPARRARAEMEEGLVELLLRDLAPPGRVRPGAHDAGALPLLSHALLATWKGGQGQRMTVSDYRTCGGIGGAVARTADDIYDGLSDIQKELARRLFLRLVYVTDDAITRRRLAYSDLSDYGEELADDVEELLDKCIDRRILTADHGTVEIAHEALLWAWPQLRTWINADRAGVRAAQLFIEASQAWEREGREPSALYQGGRLAAVRDWVDAGGRDDLPALAGEFYDASLRQEQRRTRRVYQLVAAFAVLTLFAVSATVIAYRQRAQSAHERDLALSRAGAVQADRVRGTDPSLAMQLSLAAYRIAPTPEALSSLLDSSATPTATRILGPVGTVHSVTFSPDTKTLAAGSADKSVRLWDVSDPHRPETLGTPISGAVDAVTSIAYSPDGYTLAAGGADAIVRLTDVADRTRPMPLNPALTGPTNVINSVAFSPDGSTVAAGSSDKNVWLWHISDVRSPATPSASLRVNAPVNAVAFSPDATILAAGSADGTVHLWNMRAPNTPTPVGSLAVATASVNAIAFSPDGAALAAGSSDNTVHLLDLTNLRDPTMTRPPLTGPAGRVYAVAFSLDGHSVAAGSADDSARVWDLATGRVTATLPHPGPVTTVAYRDEHTLATGAADGVARLWTLPTPILTGPAASVFTVSFSADAHLLAAASGDSTVQLWNVTDPWLPLPVDSRLAAPAGSSQLDGTLAFGTGGNLAAGTADGTVQLWDTADLSRPVTLQPPPAGLTGVVEYVTFSADGRTVAAGNAQGGVQLWSVADPRQPRALATLRTTNGDNTFSAAFSPDSHILAAASADNTVWLWNTTRLDAPTPLGQPLTGFTSAVYHVAFSPDGHILAAGGADGTVRLWDVTDPGQPAPLGSPLVGPKGYVYAVAFTPDGRALATANTDKTVWMWDLTNPRQPRQLAVLNGHAKTVFSVAVSPHGPLLAAGGQDQTVRLWNTDPADVAAHICAVAGAPITPDEWKRYLGGTPYNPPCKG